MSFASLVVALKSQVEGGRRYRTRCLYLRCSRATGRPSTTNLLIEVRGCSIFLQRSRILIGKIDVING